MRRLPTLALTLAIAAVAAPFAVQPAVAAPAGDDEEDDDEDDGPPRSAAPPREAPAADDKKSDKKDDKKDAKKDDKKSNKKDAKKSDKKDDKKDAKKDDKKAPVDVLADTEEDKKKRAAEEEARKKAEAAAAAAEAKKAEAEKKLQEEKRAAEEKRLKDSRQQRLAAARRVRLFKRKEGPYVAAFEVEPGEVKAGKLVEIRVDLTRTLEVADPRFGTKEPQRGVKLIATVIEPAGKKTAKTTYVMHPLSAPGHYGFHFTPERDGVVQVQVTGELKNRGLNATVPITIGTWPPADFDDEDKNLLD